MKDIVMAFKLARYGAKFKQQMIFAGVFIVIGLVVHIASTGTQMLGGFYIAIAGMFSSQLILSASLSGLVQSTPYRHKIHTSLPALANGILIFVAYVIVAVSQIAFVKHYENIDMVANYADNIERVNSLIIMSFLLCIVLVYCGLCYKFFIGSLIFMIAVVFGVTFTSTVAFSRMDLYARFGIEKIAIFGGIAVLVFAVLSYFVFCAVSQKPLSERAFNGMLRGK